jgi:translation initiation factor eIF-2B subunit delta
MTEWREWSAWRQVGAAALDEVGSAATVGTAAARAVAELAASVAEHAPEAFPEPILDAVELLITHQSVMAPIANLRNVVYLALPGGPSQVAAAATDLAERLEASTRLIGKTGAELIVEGSTVLIHSASSSVRSVLEEAKGLVAFNVCCTEAMPIGEGIEMAADLTAIGFDVEVLEDEVAIELLPGMDLVLAGADAVGPGSAINKTGTAAIARRARAIGVPFYLVAAAEKVLPAPLFERAVLRRGRESLAEVISLDWFTAVVTDAGVLAPHEAEELAAGRPVADQLL